jgi:tetratricopeptide (TPR) repeat protein
MAVQMQLSLPFMMAKGYGAPEAAAAVTRAREISQRLDPSAALLPALLGMARMQVARAELRDAAALAEQLVVLSEHAPDPLRLATASIVSSICYFRGELEAARLHAARGAALYDVARHGSIALAYGDDPGVMCTGVSAWAHWGLGYVEQARTKVATSLELARRLEIPYCEAMALDFASWIHLWAGDLPAAAASLAALEAVATRHGFALFMAQAMELRGWLLVQQGGDVSTATEWLERGLAERALTGDQLSTPWRMASLAQALAARGQATRALEMIDTAIATSGTTGVLMAQMHALTVKGDLCAAAAQDDEAAGCFEEAIASARRQAAKSMELRAATRLARLHQRHGKVAEARALIGDVYGWFTEGFDTPDLRDARALIESLDQPAPRARPKARRTGR